MKVLTARVLDHGWPDLPEGSLQKGATITLLVPEDEEAFALSPAEKSLLHEAIAQADRGETVDGWQLLAELGN